MKKFCTIYKSPREDEMYLYVDSKDELGRIPEALLERFGDPLLVTKMLITPEKKLARANPTKVLQQIAETGFYLQMPPAKEDYMNNFVRPNNKLAR